MPKVRPRNARVFLSGRSSVLCLVQTWGRLREAADAGFDVLVAWPSTTTRTRRISNGWGDPGAEGAHVAAMADDLKNTGKGNLFVMFGAGYRILDDEMDRDTGEGKWRRCVSPKYWRGSQRRAGGYRLLVH